MKIKLIGYIALIISFLGCKNELKINAPYKDMAVIFCFLDQNEPIQYIRIEKLYQNSVNSSTSAGAQITDSLYFDTLIVKIINIVTKDTFNCYRVDTIPKNEGFFSSGRNTIYATSIPKKNDDDEVYQLLVTNPKNNKTFSSQTSLVKDAIIEYRKITIRLSPASHSFSFRFISGKNSFLYDLIVRYQYKEMNINETDPNIFEIKNVDYYVARSSIFPQNENCFSNINSRAYLDFLKLKILKDDTKKRKTIGISFQTYGGSQEFLRYLELTKPSIGIAQKNTEYSNISNGLGIFTSRNFNQLNMGLEPTTVSVIEGELPNFTP
ncbi:MAG: hypothetical protein Q8M15_04440 [Bacteroidota bacterium]|nr:hypothetical protein [Bacteroidota bacterium]